MSLGRGLVNLELIAELINSQRADGQPIQANNRVIWSGLLNSRDIRNEFWQDTVRAMELLSREIPAAFRSFNRSAVAEARSALDRDAAAHTRCMDLPRNRACAWALTMTIAEVINRVNSDGTN